MTLSALIREVIDLPKTAVAAAELAALSQGIPPGLPRLPSRSIRENLQLACNEIRKTRSESQGPKPSGIIAAPPQSTASFDDATQLWLELADGIDRGLADRLLKPERSLALAAERLRKLLAAQGVERIETTGIVDDRIHNVVEMEQASDKELHGQIAATVRAGYRHNGKLIRPQDVIAYEHIGSENKE